MIVPSPRTGGDAPIGSDGRPIYVTVPEGLISYDATVTEITGYLEDLMRFDVDPVVSTDLPLGRQEVATAYHTRLRYVEALILLQEIDATQPDGRPLPKYWSKLRTGPLPSALSALRHQMDLGSRVLTASMHEHAQRGDAGPWR